MYYIEEEAAAASIYRTVSLMSLILGACFAWRYLRFDCPNPKKQKNNNSNNNSL